MKIQLALDRLSISEAIQVTSLVESSIDWIEVGTSLIKEFGMDSIKQLKQAFPQKAILADTKTMDNAKYELEISFSAGADIVTVMGTAPMITIETCIEIAKKYQKMVMIDLLNTSQEQQKKLFSLQDVILCKHIGKDEQELSKNSWNSSGFLKEEATSNILIAAAGGITLETFPQLIKDQVDIAIIGSAITKAANPTEVAKKFNELAKGGILQ